MGSFNIPFRIVGLQKVNLPRTVLVYKRSLINSISFPTLCSGNSSDFAWVLIRLLGSLIVSFCLDLNLAQLFEIQKQKMPGNRAAYVTLEDRKGRDGFLFLHLCLREELQGREWGGILLPQRKCGVYRCLFNCVPGLVNNGDIPA